MILKRIPSIFILASVILLVSSTSAKPWKSAEMISHETFKFGAYEARIRAAKGSGMITAFFLWKDGSELSGTEWQEQDIEIFGKSGEYQTQLMTPGNPRTPHSVGHTLATPAWDNYYTFRMEWTPDYLSFFVDGHLVRKETNKNEFAKLLDPNKTDPAQLRISLWTGDWSWPGKFDSSNVPAYTYVDYIQVFDYTPGLGPDQSDFTLRWRDDFDSLNRERWWFADWTFDHSITDYTEHNATVIDGKLVLAMTPETRMGLFPTTAPKNNPPLEPVGGAVYSGPPEDLTLFEAQERIEAEAYQAFYDTDLGNNGDSTCGDGNVDVFKLKEPAVGCYVGWTRPGEYLSFWVRIPDSVEYTIRIRASADAQWRRFHVEADGQDISGPIIIDAEDWSTFKDIEFTTPLVDGIREFSIVFDTGWINVDYFEVIKAK